jgi:hypothetical protein
LPRQRIAELQTRRREGTSIGTLMRVIHLLHTSCPREVRPGADGHRHVQRGGLPSLPDDAGLHLLSSTMDCRSEQHPAVRLTILAGEL